MAERIPDYVVGRGKVYFAPFIAGTNRYKDGEMYFGNTPEFTISTTSETLDHFSSDQGMKIMDASVLLELTNEGTIMCDEINADNLALFFLGENSKFTQTQATGVKENVKSLKKGRFYQLGQNSAIPSGYRNITNFSIVVLDASVSVSLGTGDITTLPGATVLSQRGNYEVDYETGRIYIEPDAPGITANMQAVWQFDVNAQTRQLVVSKNNMIYGSLRFISDNPVGGQKDYYLPKVSLAPDGDYALKGDDWQTIGFTFRVMKLNNSTERVYIDVRDNTIVDDMTDTYTLSISNASSTSVINTPVVSTITVRDQNNNIVPGVTVRVAAGLDTTATPQESVTDANGQVKINVNRATVGNGIYAASADGGEHTTDSPQITFTES